MKTTGHFTFIFIIFIFSVLPLFAEEGMVLSAVGKVVLVKFKDKSIVKPGEKFSVYRGAEKTGEIEIQQITANHAAAKLLKGSAAKDSQVKPASQGSESSASGAADSFSWSEYQGWMVWQKSKEKCESIGMRLPDIEELKEAHQAGVTKAWKKDGSMYWSSTSAADGYQLLSLNTGTAVESPAHVGRNLRCIR